MAFLWIALAGWSVFSFSFFPFIFENKLLNIACFCSIYWAVFLYAPRALKAVWCPKIDTIKMIYLTLVSTSKEYECAKIIYFYCLLFFCHKTARIPRWPLQQHLYAFRSGPFPFMPRWLLIYKCSNIMRLPKIKSFNTIL